MKPTRRSAGDPSRLNRVASRRSSLRFGRNTPGIPPSRALSAGRLAPTGRTGRPRRSRGFHHRLFTASLRAAHRCVSVEIHPGQFSRWGLLPHAPCQPDPHRENWASPASARTRVPPQAVHRVAARRSSLRFGRNTRGIPPSRALSAGRLTGQFSRWGPRRSRGFHHRLLAQFPVQSPQRLHQYPRAIRDVGDARELTGGMTDSVAARDEDHADGREYGDGLGVVPRAGGHAKA